MQRVIRLCCLALPLVFCGLSVQAAQPPLPQGIPAVRGMPPGIETTAGNSTANPGASRGQDRTQTPERQESFCARPAYGPGKTRLPAARASCAMEEPGMPGGLEMRRDDGVPVTRQWDEVMRPRNRSMREWLSGVDKLDDKTIEGIKRAMYDIIGAPVEKDIEHAFVSMMIGHHTGALSLAVEVMLAANSEEMIALSRQVVVAQLDEIVACKQWLRAHKR